MSISSVGRALIEPRIASLAKEIVLLNGQIDGFWAQAQILIDQRDICQDSSDALYSDLGETPPAAVTSDVEKILIKKDE